MGIKRVPWFGDWRSLAARKSPEFPRRNAKTRWGEPAGLERYGHVAVTKSMEAPGIEPGSRGVFEPASTCVADGLFLAVDPALGRLSQTASPERFLGATVPGVSRTELNLATNFWASSAKPRSSGCPF